MVRDICKYCKCVVKHWYVIGFCALIGGLGGVQNVTEVFSDDIVVPTWIWVSIIAAGLMLAQFLAWRDMRIERDARRKYEIQQETLHKLALHRDALIAFQNRPATNSEELENWKEEFIVLREEIIQILDEKISPAEGRLYAHIGLFASYPTLKPEDLSNDEYTEFNNFRSRAIRDHQWLTSLIIGFRNQNL